MSKAVKKVARIALPVIGTIIAPGIGTALGSTLGAASLSAIGGAIGGGLGGALDGGGLKGAALGAVTGGLGGYVGGGGSLFGGASSGAATSLGSAATTEGLLQAGTGAVSGFTPAVTAAGARSLGSSLTQAVSKTLADPTRLLLGVGNQLISSNEEEAAEEAARLQAQAAERAIQTQQSNTAPYRQLGQDAVNQINEINADRTGYIQNNELYQSLAADAERRLLANQAAKGKVGSGGTAAALQDQLLRIGDGLVNQEINQLQSQASIGGNAAVGAANQISNLQTQQGNAQAAGVIGAQNAQTSGYQNQINTLLALQSLNRTPTYQPDLFNT